MEPILEKSVQDQVSKVFAELRNPIEVLVFSSDNKVCEYCEDAKQLLQEVCSLTDKIKLSIIDIKTDPGRFERFLVDQVPTVIIPTQPGETDEDHRIRFVGVPGGNEFTSLIHGILMVSRGDSGLSQKTRNFIKKLAQPLDIQVFVTPTCPYCPQVVVFSQKLAFESKKVTATMVEALEFPELSDQYHVSGVPLMVINEGKGEILGALPEPQLVERMQEIIGED
jgi:glutaredoxin-like protein